MYLCTPRTKNMASMTGFWEIALIAAGVSMDAMAVSVGKGLALPKVRFGHAVKVALWFGGFQALMPLLGYFLGISFAPLVERLDHWIAFILLTLIGGNMIREALKKSANKTEECPTSASTLPDGRTSPDGSGASASEADFSVKTMLGLAVATSIDALACGVSFAFLGWEIGPAVTIIGLTTAAFSIAGLLLGHLLGRRFRQGAGMAGGIILILIGLKILVEHLQ